MNLLINAIYEQAIHDYFDYMLGGIKDKNEFDIKCIFKLFDSDLLDKDYIYSMIDTLNSCVSVMDLHNVVPSDCPLWLVKKWCKYKHKKYKRVGEDIMIYD